MVNPVSGGVDKQEFHKGLSSWAVNHHIDIEVMETTGENDHETLSRKIKEINPRAVVACGGDGTINLVGKQLLGTGIALGLVPMGSANGLATELEIPPDEFQALRTIRKGKTIDADVLCINGEHYCFHLADVGFNARLIESYEEEGGHGKMLYAKHLAGQLADKETFDCTIDINGDSLDFEAVMVVFANASKFGTGAVVNPEGTLDDGRFEICIYKPYSNWSLPWLAYLMFSGRIDEYENAEFISTDKATIRMKSPQPVQIDGEVVGKQEKVDVEVLRGQLKLIVP